MQLNSMQKWRKAYKEGRCYCIYCSQSKSRDEMSEAWDMCEDCSSQRYFFPGFFKIKEVEK